VVLFSSKVSQGKKSPLINALNALGEDPNLRLRGNALDLAEQSGDRFLFISS
jgi:hypothetical protein